MQNNWSACRNSVALFLYCNLTCVFIVLWLVGVVLRLLFWLCLGSISLVKKKKKKEKGKKDFNLSVTSQWNKGHIKPIKKRNLSQRVNESLHPCVFFAWFIKPPVIFNCHSAYHFGHICLTVSWFVLLQHETLAVLLRSLQRRPLGGTVSVW